MVVVLAMLAVLAMAVLVVVVVVTGVASVPGVACVVAAMTHSAVCSVQQCMRDGLLDLWLVCQ
jgi:hypothetical protein